jgi:hypothetical protein
MRTHRRLCRHCFFARCCFVFVRSFAAIGALSCFAGALGAGSDAISADDSAGGSGTIGSRGRAQAARATKQNASTGHSFMPKV